MPAPDFISQVLVDLPRKWHTFCTTGLSSLTDCDGQLMGLILHKGSSTNSDHYISMLKVGNIWFEFNHFCNSNTVYMLFYKRGA